MRFFVVTMTDDSCAVVSGVGNGVNISSSFTGPLIINGSPVIISASKSAVIVIGLK